MNRMSSIVAALVLSLVIGPVSSASAAPGAVACAAQPAPISLECSAEVPLPFVPGFCEGQSLWSGCASLRTHGRLPDGTGT